MNKKEAWKICMKIYIEMYEESDPKADFKKLMKDGVTGKKGWFMKYYLSEEAQTRITDKHCNKLSSIWSNRIKTEINLGSSPNTSIKTWKEARNMVKTIIKDDNIRNDYEYINNLNSFCKIDSKAVPNAVGYDYVYGKFFKEYWNIKSQLIAEFLGWTE